jgi:hypothetical protein
MSPSSQRRIANTGHVYFLFEVTDLLLQNMDLFVKLVVLLLEVNDLERARIRVLAKCIRIGICRTCLRRSLKRAGRRVFRDPVRLAKERIMSRVIVRAWNGVDVGVFLRISNLRKGVTQILPCSAST